jgi:hypothetical protein
LNALAAHHPTDTAYNEEDNVIKHLGKCLIHGGHGLQWLRHERQAIQHERYDTRQDERHDDNDETPSADFEFFSGQTTRRMLVGMLVEQFASPIQGLQDNPGSPA